MKKIIFYLAFTAVVQRASALDYREFALVREYKIEQGLDENKIAPDYQSVAQVAYEYDYANWNNSLITFLIDSSGNKYVVKQFKYRDGTYYWAMDPFGNKYIVQQFQYQDRTFYWAKVICEIVALEVGHSINVPLNHACLIPAGIHFIGKDLGVPATLHTFVPGVPYDKYQGEKYKGLSMAQWIGWRQNKLTGLSRGIIYHMSRHKDLAAIVALDTFVGNADRAPCNFFYDQATDSFIGIDMADAFSWDLCGISVENIEALINDKNIVLMKDERDGLRIYYQTLKKLVALNKPQDLCNRLDAYAQLAGIFDNTFFDSEVQKMSSDYLSGCKKTIYESYVSARKLLKTLKRLLRKHKFKER